MANKYNSIFVKAYSFILDNTLAKISWPWLAKLRNKNGKYYKLSDEDLSTFKSHLANNYYVIATRRNIHLTTYLIAFASWVKTGKASWYSHVLLNIEPDDATTEEDYWFEEATGSGVHYSKFMEVFNVDSAALLKPKNLSLEDWNIIVGQAVKQIGKPYDDIFLYNDNTHLSCVEVILDGLRALPDYHEKFPNLEAMIKKVGNITPQMYYDCPDFEVVFEVRN